MEQEQRYDPQEVLAAALDMGERILVCGGEVSRVEDTMARICRAYGAERVDALTITASIVVTARFPQGIYTQTRRISGQAIDLETLRLLNELSRRICARPMPPQQVARELERIDGGPHYGFWTVAAVWALTSGAFAVFFGGTLADAVWSAVVGVLLKCLRSLLERRRINAYFSVILCSLCGGLLALLPTLAGAAIHPALVSIGNIMLFIPGIALTNAIRDMFSGDTISGLLRCAESVLLSLAIAWGFAVCTADSLSLAVSPGVYLLTAFLGSLGFGMLFGLRRGNLLLASLGGMLAWGVVLLCQGAGARAWTAYFCAALFATLWGECLARLRHCPVTVFLVVAIIPMVPGGSLYRTMRYAISESWSAFARQGLYTMIYAIAIAAGILCVTALCDAWPRRPAPTEK